MKTTIRIFFLLTMTLGVSCLYTYAQDTSLKSSLKFEKEHKLDLDDFFKSPSQARQGTNRFENVFRLKKKQAKRLEIPELKEKVVMSAFIRLYRSADSAAQIALNDKERYITALKIYYGLDSHGLIKKFYQPIYSAIYKSKRRRVKGCIKPVDKNLYYCYKKPDNPGGPILSFQKADTGDVRDALEQYKTQIQIKHRKKWRSFENRSNWKGDSKSAIFSFQELFLLYHRNACWEDDDSNEGRVADYCDYSEPIVPLNSAHFKKNFRLNIFARKRNKHTLVFKCPDCTIYKFLVPPSGHFGNLAHLCPPSCQKLTYPIKR